MPRPERLYNVRIPEDALAEICRRYRVRELALFGSVLRDDFRPDSDVDVLVEFEPHAPIDMIQFLALQRELSEKLGRRVELTERPALRSEIRSAIVASSEVIYAAG